MEFVLQLQEEICLQKENQKQNQAQCGTPTPDVLRRSFKLACDALKSSRVLLKGGLSSKFEWFFNMYTQWYALAYVLRCLRSSPSGLEADRAWDLVEGHLPHEHEHEHNRGQGKIWRFLKLLRDQAWSLRQKQNPHLLSIATTGVTGARQPSSGESFYNNSQVLPDPTRTTVADYETLILPQWDNEFIAGRDGMLSSALDMFMPEISFLPDWNAVVNGQ
jgi:hypothetical protein